MPPPPAPGSAVLWVYSTLLMQQRVPNDFLGRISALEGAAYTISESASSVFGGAEGGFGASVMGLGQGEAASRAGTAALQAPGGIEEEGCHIDGRTLMGGSRFERCFPLLPTCSQAPPLMCGTCPWTSCCSY